MHDHSSYLEASKGELIRTVNKLEDLSQSKVDVENEIKQLKENAEYLNSKKTEIDVFLNRQLLPKQESLSNKLNEYQNIIESRNELNLINELSTNLDNELKNIDQTVSQKTIYKPKDLFPEDFSTSISTYYLSILKEINYIPSEDATFDVNTFDIIVNGKTKRSHGKGYRSLLNSLLILSVRLYFNSKSIINPHFYFIDSPLHGLMMADNVNTNENVRLGFFSYLVNNHKNDQIIIIENTNNHDLPVINFEEKGIKLIKFTQNENEGRY